jgi:hypothetical protein
VSDAELRRKMSELLVRAAEDVQAGR